MKIVKDDPIFIIHDPKRTDRMVYLQEEIRLQHIDPKRIIFIDAVKKNEPKLGISEAHKNAIRQAKQLNLRYAIVLEDDVCFACSGAFDFFESQIHLLNTLFNKWDMFIAGYSNRKLKQDGHQEPYFRLKSFSGMHCYIMHSEFFDIFLHEEIKDHVDRYICRINNEQSIIYGHQKNFAIQYPGYSDQKRKWVNYAQEWAKTDLLTYTDIQ